MMIIPACMRFSSIFSKPIQFHLMYFMRFDNFEPAQLSSLQLHHTGVRTLALWCCCKLQRTNIQGPLSIQVVLIGRSWSCQWLPYLSSQSCVESPWLHTGCSWKCLGVGAEGVGGVRARRSECSDPCVQRSNAELLPDKQHCNSNTGGCQGTAMGHAGNPCTPFNQNPQVWDAYMQLLDSAPSDHLI